MGEFFDILLSVFKAFKLALLASFKVKCSFDFQLKNEAGSPNLI